MRTDSSALPCALHAHVAHCRAGLDRTDEARRARKGEKIDDESHDRGHVKSGLQPADGMAPPVARPRAARAQRDGNLVAPPRRVRQALSPNPRSSP
jgi:hypothetical protein